MPIIRRLPANRMFLASLTSHSVTRSPHISWFRSSGTTTVVGVVVLKQPTPLAATGHGRDARLALSEFHTTCDLSTVRFAAISTPGSDWKTVDTRTSIFGIV